MTAGAERVSIEKRISEIEGKAPKAFGASESGSGTSFNLHFVMSEFLSDAAVFCSLSTSVSSVQSVVSFFV